MATDDKMKSPVDILTLREREPTKVPLTMTNDTQKEIEEAEFWDSAFPKRTTLDEIRDFRKEINSLRTAVGFNLVLTITIVLKIFGWI
jgi:hypothetical protein